MSKAAFPGRSPPAAIFPFRRRAASDAPDFYRNFSRTALRIGRTILLIGGRASLAAAFLLYLSGCDPTAPQYGAAFPLEHGDSCILVLQTASPFDQGAGFRIYRSSGDGLRRWAPVGPDRSGVACGAAVFGDELLVFHEKSVSVIELVGDPPPWRSLTHPIEGMLECGETLRGEYWAFGKDVKTGRLGAVKYGSGNFQPDVVWGPAIPHESFLLLAFRHGEGIAVAWRGVSKGGSLPDMPLEYCVFDGVSFSDVRSADLPSSGFVAMWSKGETLAGALQEGSGRFGIGGRFFLFEFPPGGALVHRRIETASGKSLLFGFLHVGHVEIGGSHYIFRSDAQKVEAWRAEGDGMVPIGNLDGIPVYEHESWVWGLLASLVLAVSLIVTWSYARRKGRKIGLRDDIEVFARIHERAAAYAIDAALMWGIAEGILILLPDMGRGATGWMTFVQTDFATVWFGTVIAYTTAFEWAVMATPGKLIMGLRVVREDGSPPTFGQVFLRNAVGFFERNLLLAPLCALPVMLLSHKVQRVGDILARTVVLTKEAAKVAALVGRLPSRGGKGVGGNGADGEKRDGE